MLHKVVFSDILHLYQKNNKKQHNPSNYVTKQQNQKHQQSSKLLYLLNNFNGFEELIISNDQIKG
jgi:hypothetical protein